MTVPIGPISLERMVRAVERVREQLARATAALEQAGIPYPWSVVMPWPRGLRVDEAAVRTTQDVNILIRQPDLEAVKTALGNIGFVYRHAAGFDLFLDGPAAKAPTPFTLSSRVRRCVRKSCSRTRMLANRKRGKCFAC